MTFEVQGAAIRYTVDVNFRRQKRIVIRKKHDGHLLVNAPHRTSKSILINMIKQHEATLSALPPKPDFERTLLKPNTLFIFGTAYPVAYTTGTPNVTIAGQTLHVQAKDLRPSTIQKLLKRTLKTWFINAVKAHHMTMCERFLDLKRFDLTFKTRYMTSRFGSCHKTKQSINLNLALIHYDAHHFKSVYAHEISHLYVSSHQKAFYNQLSQFNPHHKSDKKDLERVHQRYIRDITSGL